MTVKCIAPDVKPLIAHAYSVDGVDTETLALCHDVSKRTINRVIVEMGVNKVRNYKPRQPDLFPQYKRDSVMELPITMEEPPAPKQPEPFVTRLWALVKGALSFSFK